MKHSPWHPQSQIFEFVQPITQLRSIGKKPMINIRFPSKDTSFINEVSCIILFIYNKTLNPCPHQHPPLQISSQVTCVFQKTPPQNRLPWTNMSPSHGLNPLNPAKATKMDVGTFGEKTNYVAPNAIWFWTQGFLRMLCRKTFSCHPQAFGAAVPQKSTRISIHSNFPKGKKW